MKVVYRADRRMRLADYFSPVRITAQFTTLWEGWLVKGEEPLKRLVYVARIADGSDAAKTFIPPSTPAIPMGQLPEPRPKISFRGVELTKRSMVSDPAVLNDLQIAWKNHEIKEQGGTPRDASKATVIYKSRLKESDEHRYIIFHDAKRKVFYIQVRLDRQRGKRFEYHGPFQGDPFKRVRLKANPAPTGASTKPGAVDLIAVANLLTQKVGGRWEVDLHNAFPPSMRVLRGRIVSEPGKALVSYVLFPIGSGNREYQSKLATAYEKAKGVRCLGATERFTVLESARGDAASEWSEKVTKTLKLQPFSIGLSAATPPATQRPSKQILSPKAASRATSAGTNRRKLLGPVGFEPTTNGL